MEIVNGLKDLKVKLEKWKNEFAPEEVVELNFWENYGYFDYFLRIYRK